MDDRMLLTALGVGPRKTRYNLEGRSYEASLSPVALYNLLPEDERFDSVLALCTDIPLSLNHNTEMAFGEIFSILDR